MQYQNSTKTVHPQSVRHEVNDTPSASHWVVDSQPLAQGKHNVMMLHDGCSDCGSPCAAPAVEKKN